MCFREGGLHRFVSSVVALLRSGSTVLLAQHWHQVHRVPYEPRMCVRLCVMMERSVVAMTDGFLDSLRREAPNIWAEIVFIICFRFRFDIQIWRWLRVFTNVDF